MQAGSRIQADNDTNDDDHREKWAQRMETEKKEAKKSQVFLSLCLFSRSDKRPASLFTQKCTRKRQLNRRARLQKHGAWNAARGVQFSQPRWLCFAETKSTSAAARAREQRM